MTAASKSYATRGRAEDLGLHKTATAEDLGLHKTEAAAVLRLQKMARRIEAIEAQRKRRSGVTFRLQFVKCGKAKCRKWHGPYWYAAWKDGRRTRTAYVGSAKRMRALVRLLPDRGYERLPHRWTWAGDPRPEGGR